MSECDLTDAQKKGLQAIRDGKKVTQGQVHTVMGLASLYKYYLMLHESPEFDRLARAARREWTHEETEQDDAEQIWKAPATEPGETLRRRLILKGMNDHAVG